jgi:ribosomal protein L25 (general stress protein Ctc)
MTETNEGESRQIRPEERFFRIHTVLGTTIRPGQRRLLDAVIAKLQTQDRIRQEQAPDYKNDPHVALNYVKQQSGAEYIREQKAFMKMMRNEGTKSVADFAVQGTGKLTDAFVRGMNSAARDEHREAGKDPKHMTEEEKGQVWKDNLLQM